MSTSSTRTAPAQPFPLGGQFTSTARRDATVGSYVSSTARDMTTIGAYVTPSVQRTSLGRYVRAQLDRFATRTTTIRTHTGAVVLGG